MNISKSVTEALYLKRQKQTWLAKEMGLTDAYISSVCRGEKIPTVQKVAHMASLLGMKTSEFIALGEEK